MMTELVLQIRNALEPLERQHHAREHAEEDDRLAISVHGVLVCGDDPILTRLGHLLIPIVGTFRCSQAVFPADTGSVHLPN